MSPFFLREGFRAGSLRNVHHFVFSLPFFWSKIEYCSPVTFHRKMKLTKNVGVCTDTAIDVSHWSAGPVVVTASPELTGFSHFPLPTSVLFVRWSFFFVLFWGSVVLVVASGLFFGAVRCRGLEASLDARAAELEQNNRWLV